MNRPQIWTKTFIGHGGENLLNLRVARSGLADQLDEVAAALAVGLARVLAVHDAVLDLAVRTGTDERVAVHAAATAFTGPRSGAPVSLETPPQYCSILSSDQPI